MRILVAEDDETLRELLVSLFDRYGYVVHAVASGNEAIAMLAADPAIDVVISDNHMPDGDGADVLAFVRERDPVRPVFILMTGQTDLAELVVTAETPGVQAFFVKPFSVRELVKTVRGYDRPAADDR